MRRAIIRRSCWPKTAAIAQLALCGPALGIVPEPGYVVKEAVLSRGDMLLAYTDGVIEAKNAAEELFGKERLVPIFQSKPQNARTLLMRIEAELAKFVGDVAQSDDITMMAIRRL